MLPFLKCACYTYVVYENIFFVDIEQISNSTICKNGWNEILKFDAKILKGGQRITNSSNLTDGHKRRGYSRYLLLRKNF